MDKNKIPPREEVTLTRLAIMIQDGFAKMYELLNIDKRLKRMEDIIDAREKK